MSDPYIQHQQRLFWLNQGAYQQQLAQEYQRRQLLAALLLRRQGMQRAVDIMNANYLYNRETRNDPRFEWHTTPNGGRERAWFLPQTHPDDGYSEDDNILRDWTGGYLPRQGRGTDPMPQPEPERPPTPRPLGYGFTPTESYEFTPPDWRSFAPGGANSYSAQQAAE
jgi:hypothetical protein